MLPSMKLLVLTMVRVNFDTPGIYTREHLTVQIHGHLHLHTCCSSPEDIQVNYIGGNINSSPEDILDIFCGCMHS